MKKKITKIVVVLLTGALSLSTGCKKYLNVTPIDNLSGNTFWQTKADVEAFTGGIYNRFRTATMDIIFFPGTGDLRGAPVNAAVTGRDYIGELRNNDINVLLSKVQDNYFGGDYFGFRKITKWNDFYIMVQNSNILYEQVDKLEDGILSNGEKRMYKAEAVFLRNLAYFFMVRLYGDVAYYTNAYNNRPLARMDMVQVLDNCIADLMLVKDDLPWTYDDPSIVAVRAMRGSAIALLMHMNMWAAGFTKSSKAPYYEKVATLGTEIMNNPNTYELIPLERTKDIFKGKTKEGLFEIVQSLNYGEQFKNAGPFSDYVLRSPNKLAVEKSFLYFDTKFMQKLYPEGIADRRKDIWFDQYIYNKTGLFQMLKFVNIFAEEGEDLNPDDNQIVFRYADAILLNAEALAELGRDTESRAALNEIRKRAGATEITSEGQKLKDDIYWERCRELMGEGHYFYDLVRTRKAIDPDYSFATIGVDAFNRGAWTWPIDAAALTNNPNMVLNNYWR